MTADEFEQFFERHKQAVYQFAWRMTNSQAIAEDITQDVFVEILRGSAGFDRNRGSERALLLGIARHFAWKRWRQEQQWATFNDEIFVDPPRVGSNGIEEAVAAAVAALPPLQREGLIFAVYEGLTLQEMADVLAVELGTVKARLYRARENLKRTLEPQKSAIVRSAREHGTIE